MGDLVTPVRSVCGLREGGVVNWKLAYKELTSVIAQIRQLVLNTGCSITACQKHYAQSLHSIRCSSRKGGKGERNGGKKCCCVYDKISS